MTAASEAPHRLLIGPVNSAGQGRAWAEVARGLPQVSAASFMYRGADDLFRFTAHHVIPVSAVISNGRWRAAQERAILTGFTHAIIESGRPVFERDGDVVEQIGRLEQAGIRVALLWHGSDIRLPSAHAAREPDSPFAHGYPDTAALESIAAANHAIAVETGAFQFVSTPDLLEYAAGATWLPVVVDVEEWASAATTPAFTRARPIVVHAPSRAGLKGSDRVAEPMRRLDAEGLIEYREIHGVPSAQMRAIYGDADIVLDQFLAGSYGVAACEAMAAGRLVVGHVSGDVRAAVRRVAGTDLPIEQSRASEIERVLRRIIDDRFASAAKAASGTDFVRCAHGGDLAARALNSFLAT
ncbi:hypothetical protein [Microbacterium shaanxiense]